MFDTLLSLPLFQGLGVADLTRILESTRLRFDTLAANSTIARQGELCQEVIFVLEGHILRQTLAANNDWSLEEELTAPTVIGLEVLYGSTRTHHSTYVTCSQTRILSVDKRTIAALIGYFEVFRINVLNTLSTSIARQQKPLWTPPPTSLEGRIAAFMRAHINRPAGLKVFRISLRTLGLYLGEDYRYVSQALHKMERQGLLEMQRGSIRMAAFENIIKAKL